jgi:hypothetical protein
MLEFRNANPPVFGEQEFVQMFNAAQVQLHATKVEMNTTAYLGPTSLPLSRRGLLHRIGALETFLVLPAAEYAKYSVNHTR